MRGYTSGSNLHAGDRYSSRAADSVLNGCIPVVVMDDVHAAFESILDWNLFSIQIKEVQLSCMSKNSLKQSTCIRFILEPLMLFHR